MKCIYCDHKETEVKNTRAVKGGKGVWRRRHCLKCGATFTTTELGFAQNLFISKRNAKRQRFIYEKLFVSIFVSIDKGKANDNGSNAKLAKEITDNVIASLLQLKSKDVATSTIIEIAYSKLQKINPYFAERYIFYSEYRMKVLGTLREK